MNPQLNKIFSKLAKEDKKTELKSEKVELAIGDESKSLISKLDSASKAVNTELDQAFTPIRQLESAIDRLTDEIPSKIEKFKSFKDALQKLEVQYDKDINKVREIEKDLGVKVPFPKSLNNVVKQLEFYQKEEETLRKEISEFNTLSKKFRSLN
tara:strand:+ start:25 stop:486 length:462 start_codon:yes stop_codon:yes gene_type:complete